MDIKITVRGIDNHDAQKSESIRNYIQESFTKLESLLEKEQPPVHVEMLATVVSPHPQHEFEVHIRGPRYHAIVQRKGPELYKVIDEVMDRAFQEVVKQKDKFVDDRRREGAERKEREHAFGVLEEEVADE